jgi:serine/threonine protein kinase
MISNRHCRIYCLLNLPNNHTTKTIQHSNNNNHHHPEMEVFVEDTSGNGTLINGTTLLRKNERRKLHTGDVICLLNPKLLYKKIRNGNERKRYMQQYSYVFVNLYEQERHWNYNYSSSQSLCGVGCGNSPSATSSSSWNRKGGGSQNSNSNGKAAAVNPRATRCHSTSVGSRDDLTRRKVGGGNYTSNASSVAAAGTNTATAVTNNNNNTKGTAAAVIPPVVSRKQSLGSFLNNQSSSSRRRVEDEYDLRDLLGTGTCGEVRRAIHRRTGEERAVKIISITERGMGGANFFSKEKLSSIQAEAEILRSLDHPYVVKLFDVFVAPGKAIYLVMELIKGGDLFDRIVERERYTEVHARRLFRRILAAVHYLHEERGVVHRDLKPENILVVDRRSDVDIKLTDFGLAKNLTAEGLKTFCGTPQYFAPEVLRRRNTVAGNGRYGKEIDCWSIGVILFILLSGSPPFDVSAGFDAVASANVIFYEDQWKHISKDARDLVRRLLEKDAKKRMSVKDACEHPWLLVDDGDTHCHPLQDPVVTPNSPITKPTESEPHVEPKDKKDSLADAQAMPAPPPQIKDRDMVAAAEDSPKPVSKKRTRDTFLSKSAPQLSKIEHKKNSNSKFSRKSSLLHDSEALQQAVDIPEQKSPTSPLSKKLLFAKPSNEGSVRKISKQNVEQIKTAGNTLPKPSLSAGSRLLPKKKIQQQLGENFKKTETAKAEPSDKPAVQFSSDKENGDSKKRKQSSSTVTPPGQEQTLVFRLNKKRKTGKNVNAEEKEETGNSSVPPPKAELSEDELQSDFSDDEGDVKPRKSPAKKRKIEEFLHKKSESIQSSASIESLDSKSLSKSATTRISLSPNLAKNALASKECDTKGVEHDSDKPVDRSLKSKKKKQTFLFGKPPPSGFESTVGLEETVSPTSDAVDSDLNPIAEEGGKESVELERQPSSESMTGQATISSTKGTQKSIKNWFQPKK